MLAEAMLASGAPALAAGVVRATELDQYSENLFVGGIPNPRIHGLIETVLGWMRAEPCAADIEACAAMGLGPVDGDVDFALLQAACETTSELARTHGVRDLSTMQWATTASGVTRPDTSTT